jgi:hypothetical protein
MRRSLFSLVLLPALLTAPVAHAFQLGNDWMGSVCGLMPCNGNGGAAGLSAYLQAKVIVTLEVSFVAVALLVLLFSAANMIIFSHEEGAVKDGRLSFVYGIAGAAVVSFAALIVNAFSPSTTGSAIIQQGPLEIILNNSLKYFGFLLLTVFLVNLVIQAVRLVASRGEDEVIERSKKRLINSFIGAAIVMLAEAIITNLQPGNGSSAIATQIAGIGSYIATITGAIAVLAIVVAGIMLVVSVSDGLKDKAKSLLKTAIIALIFILVSYAIVVALVSVSA